MTTPVATSLFVFRGLDILLPPPLSPGLAPCLPSGQDYLGDHSYPCRDRACRALRLPPLPTGAEAILPPAFEDWRALPFRQALSELEEDEAARAAKGLALLNWREVSKFCGSCGTALVEDPAEGYAVGARRCPACSRIYYPRISPAVIVLVEREGKILLAHNASFPAGRFGLIAGFVEAGEGLEETCRRELREEASIEVEDLRYVSSQPWPFPDSLMLAFRARWKAGEPRPDGVEITELRWGSPDDLPAIPPPGSVARRLIDAYLAEQGAGA